MSGGVHLLAGLLLGLVGSRLLDGTAIQDGVRRDGTGHRTGFVPVVPLGADPRVAHGRPESSPGDRPAAWDLSTAPCENGRARPREARDIMHGPAVRMVPQAVVVHVHLGSWPVGLGHRPGGLPAPTRMEVEWTCPWGADGPGIRWGGRGGLGEDGGP